MPPIQILLADDDENDREFFGFSINGAKIDATVTAVADGQAFINLIKKDKPQPDIIFLDINMPKMNGMECLQELRKMPEYATVPVLMFSTSDDDLHVQEAFALGANRYVRKPDSIKTQEKLMQQIFAAGWKERLSEIRKEEFLIRST